MDPVAPDADAPPLEAVSETWLSDTLVEFVFDSDEVSTVLPQQHVRVLVPEDYDPDGDVVYPMVLLIHGAGGRHFVWTDREHGWPTSLEDWARDKDVIIVMPDGGSEANPGWYSDWYNGGEYGSPRWETFHIAQLLPWVEANLRVRTDRNGRVVAGQSMGGFGTMSYAARHPDLFAGAFAFSGLLDSRPISGAFPNIWGDPVREPARIQGHNPMALIDNLHNTRVWFRTGMGIPGGPGTRDNDPGDLLVEEAVWLTNEEYDQALTAAGVPHTYLREPQRAHNFYVWHESFQEHAWPQMQAVFDGTAVAEQVEPFQYRSTEPAFDVFGWDVSVDRTDVEFLQLADVDRTSGLAVEGSGTVTITTPPDGLTASEPHEVTITTTIDGPLGPPAAQTTDTITTTTDDNGRLHLNVELADGGSASLSWNATGVTP
ncbi:Putative esterase family [Euzebya pacifica]|uniref:Esterase family n=1 Tax=Euzebya pacifica TaxID=1608957 RepID=A0A346XWP2_9ACTN|nr:alpha/beta hydrolase family protein [Euzebya pacifica]AXV06639.1 Putative esterase family [Euzebya pacifica]